ncbi:MAG: hypothetical protein KAI47_08805, partial [Deltaproteobacteria bacterium]|nr:hypothetical protein [Deltaproteobacteria bacterium]
YPRAGTGSTAFAFTANFYDPAGAKPALATVNVDGTCHPMTLERGVDNAGSYRVAQALGSSGCHHYYFYFRDSADAIVTYPTSGSYGISVGGTTCTDFDAGTRPSPGQGCGGCFQPSDCDDHNPCTNDTCAANRCENKAIAGCCSGPAQCDDGDPCTNDTCTANACKHATIAGCCTVNTDCPDADPCTEDTCAAHQCAHKTIASCCTTAAQCDDTDPCTADDCHANACTHDTITGCCTKDTECDDGSACTKDRCEAHACAHDPIAGCCTQDADCDDTNPCTLTSCTLPAGNCAIEHIKNCCATDTDCDDTDPCTRDTCGAQNTCNHAAITGPGCIPPPSDGGGTPGSDGGSGADPGTHKPTGALIGSCQIGASPGSFAFSLLFALGILGCRRRHPRLSR